MIFTSCAWCVGVCVCACCVCSRPILCGTPAITLDAHLSTPLVITYLDASSDGINLTGGR